MSGVRKFRKRPVVSEAMQWTGENIAELFEWTNGAFGVVAGLTVEGATATGYLYVAANSASLPLEVGEWVIKDAKGFYPCNADIFETNYEEVRP